MRKLEPGLFACYLWFENENLNISLWKSESLCCLHCANEIAFSSCYLQCERENLIFYLCDLGTQDENLNISLCCLPCAWKWNSHKFARVFDMWRWKAQLFAMFLQYESWNLDFSLVSEDENLNISLSKTESLCYLQHATSWDAQLFAMLFAMWNENLSFSLCDLGTQDETNNISLCCLQCALIWIPLCPFCIPQLKFSHFGHAISNVTVRNRSFFYAMPNRKMGISMSRHAICEITPSQHVFFCSVAALKMTLQQRC